MTKSLTTNAEIYRELMEIKKMLAERSHYDTKVDKHDELLEGNGKPGFKLIRDKVMQWDMKINGVMLVILGDIAVRIVQYAVK